MLCVFDVVGVAIDDECANRTHNSIGECTAVIRHTSRYIASVACILYLIYMCVYILGYWIAPSLLLSPAPAHSLSSHSTNTGAAVSPVTSNNTTTTVAGTTSVTGGSGDWRTRTMPATHATSANSDWRTRTMPPSNKQTPSTTTAPIPTTSTTTTTVSSLTPPPPPTSPRRWPTQVAVPLSTLSEIGRDALGAVFLAGSQVVFWCWCCFCWCLMIDVVLACGNNSLTAAGRYSRSPAIITGTVIVVVIADVDANDVSTSAVRRRLGSASAARNSGRGTFGGNVMGEENVCN